MKTVTFDERSVRIAVWIVVILAVIGGGGKLAKTLKENGPKAPKEAPVVMYPKVKVLEVATRDVSIDLVAQGDVEAERRTLLVAQVGGRVVDISPRLEVGETFRAEDFLLQIDETDYTAALANAKANLADARVAIALEEASAEKAQRDWEKLGIGREAGPLVLRVPQLASAKARVLAAQGAVDKAMADLDRARVVAPYDCRVVSKALDLGATVAPGTPLLEVLSLGAVEVRLPLSLEDYGFLKRGDDGEVVGDVSATARIGGEERLWRGAVIRSAEVVEATTRSIDVVVRFEGDDTPPPGMFLSATIGGATLQGRVVLPRAAMLDARRVLLVTKDNTLEFREVLVERTESDSVVIGEGLEPGERVCLTPLSTPVTGMRVEVVGEEADSEGDKREGTPKL